MSDIAIRVENLSKLYHIGRAQQRHDTLRDALVARFRRADQSTNSQSTKPDDTDLWALRDVSFEVQQGEVVGTLAPHCVPWHCPPGQVWCSAGVIGRPAPHAAGTPFGRNGAGKSTLPSATDRRSALRARLKILSRISEPTHGRSAYLAQGAFRA